MATSNTNPITRFFQAIINFFRALFGLTPKPNPQPQPPHIHVDPLNTDPKATHVTTSRGGLVEPGDDDPLLYIRYTGDIDVSELSNPNIKITNPDGTVANCTGLANGDPSSIITVMYVSPTTYSLPNGVAVAVQLYDGDELVTENDAFAGDQPKITGINIIRSYSDNQSKMVKCTFNQADMSSFVSDFEILLVRSLNSKSCLLPAPLTYDSNTPTILSGNSSTWVENDGMNWNDVDEGEEFTCNFQRVNISAESTTNIIDNVTVTWES